MSSRRKAHASTELAWELRISKMNSSLCIQMSFVSVNRICMKHEFRMRKQTDVHSFVMIIHLQNLNLRSSPFINLPKSIFITSEGSRMRLVIVTCLHELAIDVAHHETVLAIKKRIESILGIPVDLQTLSVLDCELLNDLSLQDHPFVSEGTRIDLILDGLDELLSYQEVMPSKIEITIKFSTRQVNIEADTSETVRTLKEKIHIIDATPIKRMTLFFSGIEMDDEMKTLGDYGIRDGSEVAVLLKSMSRLKESGAQAARRLKVVVQTSTSLMNGASIPVEMKDSSTVGEVREVMLSRGMLPMDDYIFIHKQRIMRDGCSLRWHGVENGDYLYVFKGTVSRSVEF